MDEKSEAEYEESAEGTSSAGVTPPRTESKKSASYKSEAPAERSPTKKEPTIELVAEQIGPFVLGNPKNVERSPINIGALQVGLR